MADISKISPDGGTTEYNIKDATARSSVSTIEGKIPSNASSSNKLVAKSDIATVYRASGDKTCAQLTDDLLIEGNIGNVYNVTDSGTTTSDFVGGAGKAINVGDNVAVVDVGSSTYKFDLLSGFVDLQNYVQKSVTSGLIKNDGTIDTTAYATQANVIANTQLIKDTVGWVNKNEIVYPYYDGSKTVNGLTFTMLPNGGVKINGTATDNTGYNFTSNGNTGIVLNGKYKMLGNGEFGASRLKMTVEAPTGVNWNSDSADITEKEFTNATVQNIRLWMYAGQVFDNVVVYPMLWDAKILDPTFEINYGSTAFPRSEQAVLGARNELPTISATTEVSGVTITRNADLSMTLNGTSTADITLDYVNNDLGMQMIRGDRIASLGNDTVSGMSINLYKSTSGQWTLDANNREINISLTDAEHFSGRVRLYIANNKTFSNVTIKPMIRLATDTDPTYSPFAMTNRELTEKVNVLRTGIGHGSAYAGNVTEVTIPYNFGNMEQGASLLMFIKHYEGSNVFKIRMAYVTFYIENDELKTSVNMLVDDNTKPAITKVETVGNNNLKITFASAVYVAVQAIRLNDWYSAW